MKARPRSIERSVAEWITALSTPKGYKAVERIPVLGRTGPDITINELGLVIDVKSRIEVPLSVCIGTPVDMIEMGDLIGVRLDNFNLLLTQYQPTSLRRVSKTVENYWSHMDEWKRRFYPQGITTLVLHRPGRHIASSTVVIHKEERILLHGK